MIIKKVDGGHLHQCPGCDSLHLIPDTWQFNEDLSKPTFVPSVRHQWTFGETREPKCCHYFVRDGNIEFCGDCTHSLAGKTIPMEGFAYED